jgi:hypothetical protein
MGRKAFERKYEVTEALPKQEKLLAEVATEVPLK